MHRVFWGENNVAFSQSLCVCLCLIMQVNSREITSEVNCKTILPLFKERDELILVVARSPAGLLREPFQ